MRNQAVRGDQSSAASHVLALDFEVLVAMVLWEVLVQLVTGALVNVVAYWAFVASHGCGPCLVVRLALAHGSWP